MPSIAAPVPTSASDSTLLPKIHGKPSIAAQLVLEDAFEYTAEDHYSQEGHESTSIEEEVTTGDDEESTDNEGIREIPCGEREGGGARPFWFQQQNISLMIDLTGTNEDEGEEGHRDGEEDDVCASGQSISPEGSS